jgi:hypothetical protein
MTLYEVRVDDNSGRLKALWFNQPFLKDSLVRGGRWTSSAPWSAIPTAAASS